jgi:hypothetical protein
MLNGVKHSGMKAPYQRYDMTIEQTVEIPADRRLMIEVPSGVPVGKTILTFTPVSETTDSISATKGKKIRLTRTMIDELLRSETLRFLTGLLHTDMSAEEIHAERLKKHDCLS